MNNSRFKNLIIGLVSFSFLFSVSPVYANENSPESFNEPINIETDNIILTEEGTGKTIYVEPYKIFEPEKVVSEDTMLSTTAEDGISTTEYKQDMLVNIPKLEVLASTIDESILVADRTDDTYCLSARISVHYLIENITAGNTSTTQKKITQVDLIYQVYGSNTYFTEAYLGYISKGKQLLPSGVLVDVFGTQEMLLINAPQYCNTSLIADNSVWVDANGISPTNRAVLYGTLYNIDRGRVWSVFCPADINDIYAPGEI